MRQSETNGNAPLIHYEDKDLIYLTLLDDTAFLKITRSCNNKCLFCCDTVFQDGGMMAPDLVYQTIIKGAKRGIKNLFLSGGEPTIHPDFINFIKFAKKIGYEKIRAITNGRMFFYREFTDRALAAGLDEVVFSINSMNEKTHDRLVGKRGAFRQAMEGLRNVLRAGECEVNINVLVTSLNFTEMPEMPEYFRNAGAGGIDFLLVAPAGIPRSRSDHRLQPELDKLYPLFLGTLDAAKRCGLRVGMKKFPDNFFESREELLTDADELFRELAEIQRRRKLFGTSLADRTPLSCFDEKTAYCFMSQFCSLLNSMKMNFADGNFRYVRFSGSGLEVFKSVASEHPEIKKHATLIPRPSSLDELPDLLEVTAQIGRPYFLDAACVDDILPSMLASRPEPCRIIVSAPASAESFLSESDADVELILNARTLDWLNKNPITVKHHRDRIILSAAGFGENSKSPGVADALKIADSIRELKLRVSGLPRCLYEGENAAALPLLNIDVLADAVTLDIERAASWFASELHLTKSRRCASCAEAGVCRGVHLNYVRRFGYESLVPVAAAGGGKAGG